jgi:hypothetical protein
MTIRSTLLFLLILVDAAVISSVSSFALTTTPATVFNGPSQERIVGPTKKWALSPICPLQRQDVRWCNMATSSKLTQLQVAAADVEADLEMPELGNDGVYHILDERQYK